MGERPVPGSGAARPGEDGRDIGGGQAVRGGHRKAAGRRDTEGGQRQADAGLNEIARRCAAKVVYLFCPYKNEDAIKLVENSEVTKFAKDLIVSNNRLGLDPANPQAYSREARQRAVQFLRQADVILAVLPRYGMDTAWKLGYAAALGKELVGWITTEFGEESSEADYLDHWMHGWRKKPVVSTVTDLHRFIRGV